MSERDQAKQILDQLPEYKIMDLLMLLRGMLFDDEMEDKLYCGRLAVCVIDAGSRGQICNGY